MKLFERAYWNILIYEIFIYVLVSFEERVQVMWLSYFIKYYTLSLFLIPLRIKLKRTHSYNFDFLIAGKLPNQHLVSRTNEYVNGWLQINDIFLKSVAISIKIWSSKNLGCLVKK